MIDKPILLKLISLSSNASCSLNPLPTKGLKSSCLDVLIMNNDKTELLVISSPLNVKYTNDIQYRLGMPRYLCLKSVEIWVCFFFKCVHCSLHAAEYFSSDLCSQIIHAFITSRLDYCNSLLINLSKSSLQSLQRAQINCR